MKKEVIFQKASKHVIHVDDFDGCTAIIGYESKKGCAVKGVLVTVKEVIMGINLAVTDPRTDDCPPVPSDDLLSIDLDMSNFIKNVKDDWTFYKFSTIHDLLVWILT
jgi:hypothetical protein